MSDIRIVVLSHGFIFVGRYTRRVPDDIEYARLDDAACVRAWGTSRGDKIAGLGYIAKHGPTRDTRLDPVPQGIEYLRMPQEVFTIPCLEGSWASVLDDYQKRLADGD